MSESDLQPPVPLSDAQRRVLGVLIEKSLTTPDAYPMTMNGIVAGCNQKSNRSPLVQYDADDVEVTLDELRELDLVNVVISDGGRVERYRQLSRVVFGWNDEHVAIMGELMLRGRQQLGELRSRASRMKQIESLDRLRTRLGELVDAGYVRASGALERRGIEVDHSLYEGTDPAMPAAPPADAPAAAAVRAQSSPASQAAPQPSSELADVKRELQTLREQVAMLTQEVNELSTKLESVM